MGNFLSSYGTDKTSKNNEGFIEGINQLFAPHKPTHAVDSELLTTLNLEQFSGGCVVPPKSRYLEFEQQLGGSMQNEQQLNNIAQFFSYAGGKVQNDSDLEEDDLSDLDMGDVDEEIKQDGGNLSATSNANMSELNAINVSQLSATSMQNGGVQNGGSADHLTSELFGHMNAKQHGGNANVYDSLSPLSQFTMSGAGKKSSESINVMPLFSSTSGTEYYNDMQRANRYA